MKRVFLSVICAALVCMFGTAVVRADEPFGLKTAWMGENEAFPMWYAVQRGWDREKGLAITMLRFPSGAEIVRGLLAYDWMLAGCGAVPAMKAILGDHLSIVAVANDESGANAVFVRKNSPILAERGANPAFPKVFGNAQSVRGKLILCPRNTSAEQMLKAWLKALGLTEKDVRVQDMAPAQALGAFMGGLGDAVALWSPQTLQAEQKGLVMAADSAACGISQPVLLVANREFSARHQGIVEAALAVYFRAVGEIQAMGLEAALSRYMTFLRDWAGVSLSEAEALRDLRAHQVFDLRENLRLFANEGGTSRLRKWLDAVAGLDVENPARTADSARILDAIDGRCLEALGNAGE